MRSRRFWLIAAGVWLLFGLITGLQVWVSMLSHHHSVPLLMTYYVVLWEAWLTITYIVVVLVRRWPVIPPGVPNILKHIGAAFTLGTVHIIYWIVIMVWLRPFDMRTARLNQIDLIDCLASHLPLVVSKTTQTLNAQGLKVVPNYSIADAPKPDIVVFPGGPAANIDNDPEFFAWAKKASIEAEIAQSVCTGAFVLARAGSRSRRSTARSIVCGRRIHP